MAARRTSKNPSGKWTNMSDDQLAREQSAFERAVQRQQEKDREAAERGKRLMKGKP